MEQLNKEQEDYILEQELDNWRNSKKYKDDHASTDAQLGAIYWEKGL